MTTKLVLSVTVLISAGAARAASCEASKTQAGQTCSDASYAKVKAHSDAVLAKYNACMGVTSTDGALSTSGSCTSVESIKQAQAEYTAAQKDNDQFLADCSKAIDQCSTDCASEMKNLVTAIQATKNKTYCETDEPAKNKKSSQGDSSALAQVLPALVSLLAALGQSTSTPATTVSCTDDPTQAACATTVDAASVASSDLANGDARSSSATDTGSDDLSTSSLPAMGTPVQQQSSAGASSPSALGYGMMMSPASSDSPSKGHADDTGSAAGRINAASIGASSGSGGGGSMAGSGPGRSTSSGMPAHMSRVAVDQEQIQKAAVDKALQQRGIASEGPLGGITGANSLDNFKKVELRMESERNYLNER